MTKPNSKYYFRDKRLAPRQKFTQRYLRPLAAWIEQRGPDSFIVSGILISSFLLMIRIVVIIWYSAISWAPWIIMPIALVLAGISAALRRGKQDGSSD